jgi:hypothetical protein
MPDGASHLVLSVGGNDALGHSAFILNEATDSYASSLAEMARIRDAFSHEYGQMLNRVRDFRVPLAICTIYDQVPGLRPPESAGLSLFNEVITKHAISAGATLIDLRLICDEPTDNFTWTTVSTESEPKGSMKRLAILCFGYVSELPFRTATSKTVLTPGFTWSYPAPTKYRP